MLPSSIIEQIVHHLGYKLCTEPQPGVQAFSHPFLLNAHHAHDLDLLLTPQGYSKNRRANATIHSWRKGNHLITLVADRKKGHRLLMVQQQTRVIINGNE
jgi:hypothetical protein